MQEIAYLLKLKKIDSLEQVLKSPTLSKDEAYEVSSKIGTLYIENKVKDAMPSLQRSMALALKLDNRIKIGHVYHQYGNYYEKIAQFDEGMLALDTALTYVDQSKDGQKLEVYIRMSKGVILRRQSKYEDAVKELLLASKKSDEIKNDTLAYSTKTQLGILSVTMKDLDRAMQYHTDAIEIAKRMNSDRRLAKSYGNIGIIYREKENYIQGIEYNQKALDYAFKSGDSSSIAYALGEMGTMYDRSGQHTKATPYLMQSIAIRERNNEQNELAYSYFYLGSNLSHLGKFSESEEMIRKALRHALSIKNTKQVIDAYQMMYINFERNKKPDSSLYYLKKHVKLRDSLSGVDVKEKIQELNIKYESQKKDLKIKDEKIKNTYLMAGIGIMLFSIGLLYSAYRRRKLKYENKLQESMIQEQNKSTKAIIEAEENERQRIATDLHDGVGQTMTAAKMNLESLKDKIKFENDKDQITFHNAMNLVVDSVGEVRSISHNMMPNSLLKNGLGKTVRNFLDNLNQQKLKVQLFTDGLDIPIESNTEIFIYRIIQECVNNILKHANASEINISILIDQKELDVTIEDNGIGFNPEQLKDKTGIGISNILKRIQFLKGTIHWDSQIGKGTTVVINIPFQSNEL